MKYKVGDKIYDTEYREIECIDAGEEFAIFDSTAYTWPIPVRHDLIEKGSFHLQLQGTSSYGFYNASAEVVDKANRRKYLNRINQGGFAGLTTSDLATIVKLLESIKE